MLIDTHCHLDASAFEGCGAQVAAEACALGVQQIIVPAVCRSNFSQVASLGRFGGYTLGIHPVFVPAATADDLLFLRDAAATAMHDPYFVGIGEIGLDFFIPDLCQSAMRDKQTFFYAQQLQIAREFGLPVLLHSRRSVDQILKQLRLIPVIGGIAHAFNGSVQQAGMLINAGFKLGFGGACTFSRALHLRRLVTELPLSALVLETDAPDMPPAWLHSSSAVHSPTVNSPVHLLGIAEVIAELRAIPLALLAAQTTQNACAVLPRLQLSHYPDNGVAG